ncbi:alpha-E domain-containing protein [Acidiferrobacter sp.]|uniref:alpha-E domain-containing protein n=1 Tax=Acidiferrobacter sp. TaxID=1872107 RepID=UPI0026036189|nr:alpha-E domain-containing protein [Acidiferrobacter sp.]
MLSRVAEAIYWTGRYMERAESTARLIDVNLYLSLDASADYGGQWEPLVRTGGGQELFARLYPAAERDYVMRFLTFDTNNPNSIMACAWRSRENARAIRDTLPSEMWEQANRFYDYLRGCARDGYVPANPHEFYTDVKMAAHLFDGIADATMTRGDAWRFWRLGKMIERADTTSRILDVKYFILLPHWQGVGSAVDAIQWAALLKSASAMEMYRKRYRGVSPAKVAGFLILSQEFPRAIRWCVDCAEDLLCGLATDHPGDAVAGARRQLESLAQGLCDTQIENIIERGLHEFLDDLQTRLNGVHDALARAFFPQIMSLAGAIEMECATPTQ